MIIVQGIGTVRTLSITKKLGAESRRPQILICYDLLEGLIDEKEDLIFETKPQLFSIGTITISNETISLLSKRVSKIKINKEFNTKQGTSNQGTVEVAPSTTKTTKFNVRLKISLEDKVYLETYYHHNQVNIEVDETSAKI